MNHILIVEDEQKIAHLVRDYLQKDGFETTGLYSGEGVVEFVRSQKPHLILLDLMLPGSDGLALCRDIRQNSQVPIIMLTAKIDEIDRLLGLELGADDYICKPFSPRELTARIRAILRRRQQKVIESRTRVKQEGEMIIDRAKHVVTIEGEIIDLTLSEFELLSFLADKKGWVFTRGQIVDAIHGENYAVTERSIDVIIVGLRKKLKQYASLIETVRGVGYRFKE